VKYEFSSWNFRIRVAFFLSIMIVGFIKGGFLGLWIAFMLFGLSVWAIDFIFGIGEVLDNAFHRGPTMQITQNTLNIEPSAMRGQPDPTGPDEVYSAVIGVRRKKA
jgi:hypothetical protein